MTIDISGTQSDNMTIGNANSVDYPTAYIKLRAGSNCYLFFPGCPVVDINLSNLSFGWHDIREFLASSFSALIYAQMGSRLSDFNLMLFPWDGIRE